VQRGLVVSRPRAGGHGAELLVVVAGSTVGLAGVAAAAAVPAVDKVAVHEEAAAAVLVPVPVPVAAGRTEAFVVAAAVEHEEDTPGLDLAVAGAPAT